MDDTNLDQYVDIQKYRTKNLSRNHLANIVRMKLLLQHGGLWVDATVFCTKPLDSWFPAVVQPSGFFAYANPGPDRLCANWLLYSEPNNPLVHHWLAASEAFWETRQDTTEYFWMHRLFGELYATNSQVKQLWDATPKLPACRPGPLDLAAKNMFTRQHFSAKQEIQNRVHPLYKLTWKCGDFLQEYKKHTVLYFLFTTHLGTAKTFL